MIPALKTKYKTDKCNIFSFLTSDSLKRSEEVGASKRAFLLKNYFIIYIQKISCVCLCWVIMRKTLPTCQQKGNHLLMKVKKFHIFSPKINAVKPARPLYPT